MKLNLNNRLTSKRNSKEKEDGNSSQNGKLDKNQSPLPSNSKKSSNSNIKNMKKNNDKSNHLHSKNQSSITGKCKKIYFLY